MSFCVFELPGIHTGLSCAFSIFLLLCAHTVLLYMVFTPADCGGDAVLAALHVLKEATGTGPVSIQACGPEHPQEPCWNKTWLMSLLAVSRPEDEVVTCFEYCCWGCAEGPPQGFFSPEIRCFFLKGAPTKECAASTAPAPTEFLLEEPFSVL